MIRCILIPILISPAAAFSLQDAAPGLSDRGPRPFPAVSAVASQDDGFVCGECPCPEPEPGGGHASLFPLPSAREAGPPRGRGTAFRRRGPCPVLSSLSDSLTIGRPPPAVFPNAC